MIGGDRTNIVRTRWWTLVVSPEIDHAKPGIYEWRIGSHSVYIGKSKRLLKRISEYPNNVRKLLAREPYRRGKPTKFRVIHHSLRMAHDELISVTVIVLETCEEADLTKREHHWIAVRRQEEASGGPKVLNATKPQSP